MLIADRLVYLQLQKTGSTFIGDLLAKGLAAEQVGKHEAPRVADADRLTAKLIVGSIRNPLDWYVSLWGYTCSGRGELYDRTAGSAVRHAASMLVRSHEPQIKGLAREFRKDRSSWARLYRDVDDAGAFQQWLTLLHQPEGQAAWRFALRGCSFDSSQGLYSHWYRRCFSWRADPLQRHSAKGSLHGSLAIERHVRLEDYVSDLTDALKVAGYSKAERDRVLALDSQTDRNASSHASTDRYWTNDLRTKFRGLDSLVFEAGNY